MPERTLSTRHLNRALLARQLLLERADLPVTAALERMGGLQDQYAPSGYIGLWSRLRDFAREDLTRALVDRSVIQATLLRSTIHLVTRRDYVVLTAAVRRSRRAWWQRTQGHQLDGLDMDAVADRVRSLLADGPRRQSDIAAALEAEGFPRLAWVGVGEWLDLVRVPPSGTWERRRADLYGLASTWLAGEGGGGRPGAGSRSRPTAAAMPDEPPEDEAQVHLIRRYLGAFGPAPLADIATWGGLNAKGLAPLLDRLDLRRFRDEAGGELLDLPDEPLPDPDTPAPPRFIATWDAMLLVHARRTLVLPEDLRPKLFNTKTPHSMPSFLVDGQVAGSWRWEEDRIALTPFVDVPRAARRALDDEAERLADFHRD